MGEKQAWILSPVPEVLLQISEKYLGHRMYLPRSNWPNSVNLNLYEDGSETIGWHADDEPIFDGLYQDCCIISVSLGACRTFELALQDPKLVDGAHSRPLLQQVWRTGLNSGDVCVMEGRCQRHYFHQLPMAQGPANAVGPRVNLTYRWIRTHHSRCSQ